jgi:putative ABC transport system permease protein
MPLWPRLVNCWRDIFQKDRVEQELTEEVETYLEMLVDAKIKEGLGPSEARRAALIELGGIAQVKESVRDVRMGRLLEAILQDIRYAVRILLKQPGFTLVATLATALGIAANTAVFSTAHALILRPFNFPEQDRLIVLWEQNLELGNVRSAVAAANFNDWREQNHTCDELVAIEQYDFDLTDVAQPDRIAGYRVTAGFFEVLGTKVAYGRSFSPEDYESGQEQVVILKHSFWQQRFGADPQIIGRTLTINQKNFFVIGVMPPDFNYPYRGGQIWTPLILDQQQRMNRERHYLQVIGKLKRGVDVEQAQADLADTALHTQKPVPDTNSRRNAVVVSLTADATRGAAIAMPALIGGALTVLLVACSNVANLLLARSATRRKEFAMRLALGAGRLRIVRQLLTEGMLLAGLGGSLGLLISVAAVEGLVRGIPEGFSRFIPGWHQFGLNPAVFFFTLTITAFTGALFSLAPTWQAAKMNMSDAFKATKGTSDTGGRHRLQSTLVVTEIALSVTLLISAGLLVRSFVELRRSDLGINPENVLALEVALPYDRYKDESQCRDFYDQLLRSIESVAGVVQAGAISSVPISGRGGSIVAFRIVGRPAFPRAQQPSVQHRVATPGYFKAIGTALRRGRLFTAQDDSAAPRVVLVNEAMERLFFPGQEPIGEHLIFGDRNNEKVEIIGVVADVKNDDLEEQADATVYMPYAQSPTRTMNLIVKTNQEPAAFAGVARIQVSSLDPMLPVSNIKTLVQMVEERLSPKRLLTWMIGVLAVVALLLAALGVYALNSYAVAQRTHEIGIRMALGAKPADVLRLVLWQGLKLTVIGVIIGLVSAIALTRTLSFFLFGVTGTDPLTYTMASLVLGSVALVACYIPSRTATKVDPMIALRYE